jgi:hypothetical protein
MAKRKAARSARKTASRAKAAKPGARKAVRASARKSAKAKRPTIKRAAAKRPSVKRTAKAAGRKATKGAAKAAGKTSRAVKGAAKQATRKAASPVKTAPRKAAVTKAVAKKAAAPPVRKAPSLNRQRRILDEEIIRSSPPSSLDMNRSASAVRTGRRELKERYDEHTETSPALTAGDVDADWESAYSVGDEAPGGDNPTPDQDIVDDIGRAVGIEYQDNEELKGADKVEKRDRNRWELDPASSDDWDERD